MLEIKIPLIEKEEKLQRTISIYKRDNILKIETYKKTVEKAIELQTKKRFFRMGELVDYYKTTNHWAERKVDSHLKRLIKENIVIKISKGQYKVKVVI